MDYSIHRMYLVEESYFRRLEIERNLPSKYTVVDLVRPPAQARLENLVGDSNRTDHQPEDTPLLEDSHLNWEGIPSADLATDKCQPVSAGRAAKSEERTLVGWCW
jgi:hypothetical protein